MVVVVVVTAVVVVGAVLAVAIVVVANTKSIMTVEIGRQGGRYHGLQMIRK